MEKVCVGADLIHMNIRRNECVVCQNRIRFKDISEDNLGNSKIGQD